MDVVVANVDQSTILMDIELANVDKKNLSDFKHLHNCIFPIAYSNQFYKEIFIGKRPALYEVAYVDQKPVGVLSAQVNEDKGKKELYVLSLGCKILHRRKGIGSRLLSSALKYAYSHNCGQIRLHVQESNESALQFYKMHGFVESSRETDFYKRLHPSGAIIMRRDL